jgi:hypothetical protein
LPSQLMPATVACRNYIVDEIATSSSPRAGFALAFFLLGRG